MKYPTISALCEGVAGAIRAKEGSTEKINPQDFVQRIENLQVGGGTEGGENTYEDIDLTKPEGYEPLTDEEKDIVRRGRNANPHSTAKNADIIEYKYATGFEALIGWLYLNENTERLHEILNICVEII